MVRLLLEFGADVHTTDAAGHNALHSTLLSRQGYDDDVPEQVEEKLTIFIKTGVDVHHRNRWGQTPSYVARFYSKHWEEWCRVLERNGLSVSEIVQVDSEDWILEEGADEEWDLEDDDTEDRDSEGDDAEDNSA
jgi:hypothetical protein